jgi:hypothetical protein
MNSISKKISETLNLENLPLDDRQEVIIRIGALVYQNVLMRSMEIMTEQDKDEFEKMLDKNADIEEVFIFLKEKVKDLEKIIEEEAIKLKNKSDKIMGQIG